MKKQTGIVMFPYLSLIFPYLLSYLLSICSSKRSSRSACFIAALLPIELEELKLGGLPLSC